ncbi:MAG TPA: VWA domain-containing protein, partial [Polyangiales bacterium]|nr:VWA domain-containing protein [Polyangiales bacterium]
LAVDDRAYAVVPERRRVRVLCVTAGNRYLEAALLLDEYLDVDAVSPEAYRGAAGYDAVVFDRFVPATPPGKPSVFIAPAGSGPAQPFAVSGTIDRPLFERVQGKHPLLRFTALRDVNVASALKVQLQAGDQAVAADARGPLIVTGTRHQQPFVALTFDLHASDLPLRPAWPLLLLNAIDGFSAERETYASASSVGEPVAVALPSGAQSVRVVEPDGSERSLQLSVGSTTFTPTRAGLYRIHWQAQAAGSDPGGAGERWLAVNLAADSRRDLTPTKAMRVAGTQVAAPARERAALPAPIWALLVLAALLMLSGEWFSYHRRWTV